MADSCPECGADATVTNDGIFCAGPSKVSKEQVAAAEVELKKAMSLGLDTAKLDAKWRKLAAQASCGQVS